MDRQRRGCKSATGHFAQQCSNGGNVVPDYTLADLEAARRELARWQERWADSNSNNPDKHEGEIRAARHLIWEIGDALKRSGAVPLTE